MIERDHASEFTPPETPSVFSPVHRNGDYSISKSVFGKHSLIFIICDTNFRPFEIHPDFEICTLRNSNLSKVRFFLCENFCFENNPLYGILI